MAKQQNKTESVYLKLGEKASLYVNPILGIKILKNHPVEVPMATFIKSKQLVEAASSGHIAKIEEEEYLEIKAEYSVAAPKAKAKAKAKEAEAEEDEDEDDEEDLETMTKPELLEYATKNCSAEQLEAFKKISSFDAQVTYLQKEVTKK